MELSTSKIIVNTLIVTAILLIGVSVTSVLMKKPAEVVNNVSTPAETIKQPIIEENSTVSTTTESTTTEMSTPSSATSTATSTSQANENKNLTSKKWTWVKTTISGTSTTPKKANAFSVTFNATGTITGTTDCNNYFGSYKTTDSNKLTLGPIGSTKMFCGESQENDFMSVLQKVIEYSIDKNNNLILTTGSGTMMFK